jgi:hypothetical protein
LDCACTVRAVRSHRTEMISRRQFVQLATSASSSPNSLPEAGLAVGDSGDGDGFGCLRTHLVT